MTLASPTAEFPSGSARAQSGFRLAIAPHVAGRLVRMRGPAARLVTPVAMLHAARTVVAGLLALWLAFLFQLETPYSALTTVMLVANPVQGMILEKSLYRFGGTVLGGLAALILMAVFAQTPELFLLGLAVWMAFCTAASTLLRGHRAYGAVLAGYTVALIALPVTNAPESIFAVAMARAGAVTLGIVSSALVGALLTGHTAQRRLDGLLRNMLADLVAVGRAAINAGSSTCLSPGDAEPGPAAWRPRRRDPLRGRRDPGGRRGGVVPARRRRRAAWRIDAAPGLRDLFVRHGGFGLPVGAWAGRARMRCWPKPRASWRARIGSVWNVSRRRSCAGSRRNWTPFSSATPATRAI